MTCASLILLSIFAHDAQGEHVERERHHEQDKAQREGGERLRIVELSVADEQRARSAPSPW